MKCRRRKRLTSQPNTGFTSSVTTAVPMNSQRIASMPRCMPSDSRVGRSTISAVSTQKKNSAEASTGATSSRRTLGVQVDDHVEAVRPGVRRELELAPPAFVHRLLRDRQPGEHRVRLVLVEALVLEQRQQFVPRAVQLTAGDRRAHAPPQLRHAVPVMHVQRLLEPADAELVAAAREGRRALHVPVRVGPEQRHRPALVGVDAERKLVPEVLADRPDERQVFLQRGVLDANLDRVDAYPPNLVEIAASARRAAATSRSTHRRVLSSLSLAWSAAAGTPACRQASRRDPSRRPPATSCASPDTRLRAGACESPPCRRPACPARSRRAGRQGRVARW
jgi:hypothetical protein